MQRWTSLALLLAGVVATPVPARAFEGVVTAKLHDPHAGALVERQYLLRNGAMRIDSLPDETPGVVIADPSTKTIAFVMPQSRTYVVWPMAIDDASTSHPDVVRTGRKDRIAGYECEYWLLNDTDGETSACITTGIGAFVLGGLGEPRWSGFLRAQGGFPLKVSKVDATPKMEVTKIEPKAVDAALFSIPATYTEIDLLTGAPRRR